MCWVLSATSQTEVVPDEPNAKNDPPILMVDVAYQPCE